MRGAHGGDLAGVAAVGDPIEKLRADRPAHSSTVSRARGRAGLAGDQQHQPRALRKGQRQPMFQPRVGRIKVGAMQIKREVWRDLALGKAPIPASVQPMLV